MITRRHHLGVALSYALASVSLVGLAGVLSVTPGISHAPSVSRAIGMAAVAIPSFVPANDLCANAEAMFIGDTVAGATTTATFDGVGFCGTANTAPGVWYSFIGNGNSVDVTTSSAGTNYDTKLTVFTGSCGSLVCVDGDDDSGAGLQSLVNVCATVSGVEYLVLVHGFGSAVGDFDLSLIDQGTQTPSNDDVCNAIWVASDSSTGFDNTCANAQSGEVSPGPGTSPEPGTCNDTNGWCSFETGIDSSIWYTFTAPPCGGVQINAFGRDYQLAVWEVANCNDFGSFIEIGANDDSGPGFSPQLQLCGLAPGQTYYIQIDGFASSVGPGTLSLAPFVCEDCPDVNCDGFVWWPDVWIVIANFGASGPHPADVNNDGVVNFQDYLIVISSLGQFCGVTSGGWWWWWL